MKRIKRKYLKNGYHTICITLSADAMKVADKLKRKLGVNNRSHIIEESIMELDKKIGGKPNG